MQKILVIGSSNIDLVITSTSLPKPGETVIGDTFLKNPGGKGANQAVAANRLGGNVAFITKVGNDVFGKELKELYKKEGINCHGVMTDNSTRTGVALINVDRSGENFITIYQGANKQLLIDDIINLSSLIDESDIILMQLEIPMDTVNYIINHAFEKGKKIILNPAPAHSFTDEALSKLFAITPNKTETEQLTGIEIQDERSVLEAASILIKKGVKNVIITLGSQGAYYVNEKEHFLIPAPHVKAVDSTAAGDTFCGAIAAELSRGHEWDEALQFATAASAICVTRMGAQLSIPTEHEVRNFIKNNQ